MRDLKSSGIFRVKFKRCLVVWLGLQLPADSNMDWNVRERERAMRKAMTIAVQVENLKWLLSEGHNNFFKKMQ